MLQLDEPHLTMAKSACNFVYEEIFLNDVYGFQLLQRPVGRVLDIGAHVGMASTACRLLWPEAEIICVEPPTGNQPALCRMISGQRIRLIVAALGDDGIEMLHCGSKDPNLITGAHGYFKSDVWTDPVDRDKTTHNVGCIGRSLHTLVAKFKTKTDGLVVKIDCEGGEWSMMRNRQSDEAVRSADYLTMEAHTFGGSLNGATYEEIANWTNRFAETHDALIPEIEQCCQGGFMLGLLKKGFVSEERTDRLKRHFLQQVAGRATILTD